MLLTVTAERVLLVGSHAVQKSKKKYQKKLSSEFSRCFSQRALGWHAFLVGIICMCELSDPNMTEINDLLNSQVVFGAEEHVRECV